MGVGGGGTLNPPIELRLCVRVARAGRSTAAITTAGTVGGPYVLGRSNSFLVHQPVAARKNSATTAGELSTSPRLYHCCIIRLAHSGVDLGEGQGDPPSQKK